MKTVYLAIASTEYEGYDVMRAFESQLNAEDFAAACRQHYAALPKCPELHHDDKIWRKYDRDSEKWRAHAPVDFAEGDCYSVVPVPFVEKK